LSGRRSWLYIDHSDLIDGEKLPARDKRLDEIRQMAAAMTPRLKSLLWAARKQPAAFAPALFLFQRKRWTKTRHDATLLPAGGWSVLALIPAIDQLRESLGANWDPMAGPSSWTGMLFEAADDVVQAIWMLRVGATAPAALVTRTLLERWTHNVAHHHQISRLSSESEIDFMSRVWQTYSPYGVSAHVGSWWGTLSEIAHGRQTSGRLGLTIVGAISRDPLNNVDIHKGICEVLELCLRQVRGGLTRVVVDAGQPQYVPILQTPAPQNAMGDEPFNLTEAYEDLDYYEANKVMSERWTQLAVLYRRNVRDPERRLFERFDRVLTVEALLERRGRAIERARHAFKSESELAGSEFDPGHLAARLFRYGCIAELARQLAHDGDDAEALTLFTAAQCLESAVHLWLEDSDYSMGCVRIVLEQTARLRVHRLKKSRALKMETRGDTSASRWLEEAGWRRLSILLRATNEFAHLGSKTRRGGARNALLHIQVNDPHENTSRGGALQNVAYLLGFELHARLLEQSPEAAACFTESVTLVDEAEQLAHLERYLANAYAIRDLDFGEPDFTKS
jgi:hypothetical protein